MAEVSELQQNYLPDDPTATFIRQATPGTTYWRCEVPASRLPANVIGLRPELFSITSREPFEIAMQHAVGPLVWQFLGDDARTRIAFQLQAQGYATLQEVDDNYLRSVPSNTQSTWAKTHAEAKAKGLTYSHEMHRALTPLFDGIICATDFLADLYSDYHSNVFVCRNSVKPEDWNIERHTDDVLRIGYYGSPSHNMDWPYVKKAFKWASRQPGVECMTIGFRPPGWTGRAIPWADSLGEARAKLGLLDIGVAPLRPNEWSNSKSDVKALEYAMAGVLPIVSRSEPYRPWWDEQGWEWTAQTQEEWLEIFRHLVHNPDEVKAGAEEAKRYVLEHRNIDTTVERWREVFASL